MQNNPDSTSIQDALRLAQSETGQQLLSLLKKQNPRQLQLAMAQASAGNYEQMKQTISALLASEDAQSLLKELRG